MNRLRVLPVLITLLAVPLSGCLTDLFEDEPIADSVLARKITVTLDDETFEGEPRFEDIVQAWYEYTHPGGSVAVDALSVSYTDERGDDRTDRLSVFTAKSSLSEGDVVKITGVNITSDLRIFDEDGTTIAEREGMRPHWFRAQRDGEPMPLASTKAGEAVWSLTGSASVKFDVRDVAMGEEGHLEYAKGDFRTTTDGKLTAVTEVTGATTDLRYDIDMEGTLDALLDSRFEAEGETADYGFDVEADGRVDGELLLGFRDNVLDRTGSGGSIYADGKIHVWDPEHPRSMRWEPEDVQHPFFRSSQDFSEERIEPDPWSEVDAELVAFLERLWGMTLDVGDEFRFSASTDEEGEGFAFEVVIQVTERVARNVGFESIDTFRVHESMRLDTRGGYGAGKYELATFTTWLATDTYLPVYAQVGYTKSYDEREIRSFYGLLQEDVPFDLPDDLKLAVTSDAVLRLEEYSGDLTVSPLLGMTGLSGPMTAFAYGMGVGLFMEDEYEDYEYEEIPPPEHEDEWDEEPHYPPEPTECYWDENGDYVCE